MPSAPISPGVELNYETAGEGEPLLLITGTSASLGFWQPVLETLARNNKVIAYDHRGMGGSSPSTDAVTMASLADDARALLDHLGIDSAHILGWSLGSTAAQELALAHPERVRSLVLYGTWAKVDGFQTAMLTALRHPWATGDMEAALGALGLAFSPQLLSDPSFEQILGQFLPLFPQTAEQIQMTVNQWDADLAHDTFDRLPNITAPTTVLVGEQDLLTPPWQSKAVADRIPDAEFVQIYGAGASHGMHLERTEDWLNVVTAHLAKHAATPIPLEA